MKAQIKIKVSDMNKLKADVQNYLDKVGTEASKIIAKDLNYEAHLAILAFYSSYTPHVYERNYYNFMTQSFRQYVNKDNGVYEGGVELDPESLDELYEDPASIVFNNVYEGYHGNPEIDAKYGIPRMQPTPKERIFARRDELVDKYLNSILTLAQAKV